MTRRLPLFCSIALLALVACNNHGESADDMTAPNNRDMAMPSGGPGGNMPPALNALPLVTPPVRAVTPNAYQSSPHPSRELRPLTLSSSDIKSRFFSNGPTNIFSILAGIDGRIAGINMAIQSGGVACLKQSPVAYSITPVGQTVTMYAQCYSKVGGMTSSDPGLLEFGQKDGVTYLYSAIGQGEIAAIVTPLDGDGGVSASGASYHVEAWMSVGTLNAATSCNGSATWDGWSYGVIHLTADPATRTLEMTVAGIGFGYCGAQLRSDGASIYVIGSPDMGMTCAAVDTTCVAASDGMSAGDCSALTNFGLTGLGREAVHGTSQQWAASTYPVALAGTGNTLLNGTSSDAVSFGPTTPTPGTASN